jgi:hypothetical protein
MKLQLYKIKIRKVISYYKVAHHLEGPGVGGRIILKWIFRNWDVGVWTGSIWLRIGIGGRHL